MCTHPVFVRLEGRRCVVAGGDAAAAAKAAACRRAGGRVVVIAPSLAPEMTALIAAGDVAHVPREAAAGDLAGAFLAYVWTRDAGRIEALMSEAARERVLLNVVDVPEACTFLSPAVVERGRLQIAVGTGGASPGLAARLRRQLEAAIGPEYGPYLDILGAVRRALGRDPGRAGERARVLDDLLGSPLLELIRRGSWPEVDALLGRVAGEGCTLARLGVPRAAP
jgi:precorrin-2 dehydrogenase / sirohydrochlorin ferrochelatase